MKHSILIFLILSITTCTHCQEMQVPLDTNGSLYTIDIKTANKLKMFGDYSGFEESALFRLNDSTYKLEIVFTKGNNRLKDRIPLNKNEVAQLRDSVSNLLNLHLPSKTINQDGRNKLIISTSALSLGYYGWALPSALDIDDGRGFIGLYMLTSGAGFYLPYAATKNSEVSPASADLSLYGQTRGIVHGNLFPFLFSDIPDERAPIFSGMAFSIAEGFAGYLWARQKNISQGKVSTMATMGDFGAGLTMGLGHVVGFFDNESTARVAGSIIAGSWGGTAFGYYLDNNGAYTKGDGLVLRGAGMLGAYLPVAFVALAEPADPKVFTGVATLGGAAGVYIGHRICQNNNFTTGQGTLVLIGTSAGALVGLGTGYLFSENYKTYLISSAIGATAGFWFLQSRFANKPDKNKSDISFNFNINPLGLMELAGKHQGNYQNNYVPPLFSARVGFLVLSGYNTTYFDWGFC